MESASYSPGLLPPPGWYPDPQNPGQRYWDGNEWTVHRAPPPDGVPKPGSEARTGDWVGGVLLSILVPLIGLIAGAVYATKGGTKQQVGIMCIAISVVSILFWAIVTSSSGGSGY